MKRFFPVFLGFIVLVGIVSLTWPRFFDTPRPQPLDQINGIIRNTEIGQKTANILGVSDESNVEKLTPGSIAESATTEARERATDTVITHISRLIVNKFSSLPQDQQERILEALTKALNPSPAQNLPEATQSSTQSNQQTGENQ
jgi:hypothetical protein